jgi:hypothetical protein
MSEIRVEPDRVAGGLVYATIIAAAIAIAASALVVYLLASRLAHGGGRSDIAHERIEPPADPFSLATAHELRRRDQHRELDSWQWADAGHTRLRMPIELAIERTLEAGK